jgi:hypothetical protein
MVSTGEYTSFLNLPLLAFCIYESSFWRDRDKKSNFQNGAKNL